MNEQEIAEERSRLYQDDLPQKLIPQNPREFVTVFDLRDAADDTAIFSALVPVGLVSTVLSTHEWDITYGDGRPYFEHDGNTVTSYQRISDHKGVEPFIHDRDYHNRWRSLPEVIEEFRLFHNLYHDSHGDLRMVDHDDAEVHVGFIKEKCVSIQLGLIQQFLAVRDMFLAIYFASNRRSNASMTELGFKVDVRQTKVIDTSNTHLFIGDGFDDAATFSRKLGKVLIPPIPQNHASILNFYDGPPATYEDFIIGLNSQGNPVLHTCDRDTLATYFSPDAAVPSYLTRVAFNRTVLDRYYGEPSRFEVVDGLLRCRGLWGLKMDNHHRNVVFCALGDLGYLPAPEQLHWKAHNIPPSGNWSDTTSRRWFNAEFAPSARPEDLFSAAYNQIIERSTAILGEPILKPLHEDDADHYAGVRVPTKNEQLEFDRVIVSLTKVVPESLNVRALRKLLPEEYVKTLPQDALNTSINVLNHAVQYHGLSELEIGVQTLRDIQSFRSKASVHRRGSGWRKAAERLNPKGLPLVELATSLILEVTKFLTAFSDSLANLKNGSGSKTAG